MNAGSRVSPKWSVKRNVTRPQRIGDARNGVQCPPTLLVEESARAQHGAVAGPAFDVGDLTSPPIDDLRAGKMPDRDAIAAAHPEIAACLRRRLAVVEMLHNAARKN